MFVRFRSLTDCCSFEIYQKRGNLEDTLYIVKLEPDEFHELLSEYENFFEWYGQSMPQEQKELAQRLDHYLTLAGDSCVDKDALLSSTKARRIVVPYPAA